MKELVAKLRTVEKDLSDEHGEFSLFALFLREQSLDKWDLLISADWIDKMDGIPLKIVVNKLNSYLSKKELLQISRVVIIQENNPDLVLFQDAISEENQPTELRNSDFFGMPIKHAYVITSQRSRLMAG